MGAQRQGAFSLAQIAGAMDLKLDGGVDSACQDSAQHVPCAFQHASTLESVNTVWTTSAAKRHCKRAHTLKHKVCTRGSPRHALKDLLPDAGILLCMVFDTAPHSRHLASSRGHPSLEIWSKRSSSSALISKAPLESLKSMSRQPRST